MSYSPIITSNSHFGMQILARENKRRNEQARLQSIDPCGSLPLNLPKFNSVTCPKCGRSGALATPSWIELDDEYIDANPDSFMGRAQPGEFQLKTCDCGFSWCELTRDASATSESPANED